MAYGKATRQHGFTSYVSPGMRSFLIKDQPETFAISWKAKGESTRSVFETGSRHGVLKGAGKVLTACPLIH